jgi:anthranilate/para-aminobenzoate synthase component II
MPASRSVHDPRGPVLVLDNYDSFTYNLVQYLGELGERPIVRRNDAITVEEIGQMGVRAVVISPGPCTPREGGISNDTIRHLDRKSTRLNSSHTAH